MKITFMIDHLYTEVAGTENQLMKLVRNLAHQHQVELICLRETDWLKNAAGTLPCKVSVFHLESYKTFSFWKNLSQLIAHLKRSNPDILHTFFPIANSLGVMCGKLAGVQCIISSRRDYGHWFTPTYLKVTRFANRFVSAVLCNSAQVKLLTENVEGVPPEQVFVIPNGVEIDKLYRGSPDLALKTSLGIPADHAVVTIVANFREVKRHDTLLHAMQLVLAKQPKCTLLMLGTDVPGLSLQSELLALAQDLGISNNVIAHHAKQGIENYLSISDVGVNSSENEGLSNAVIEYMCAKVVSVVSDGGGNRDLVQDGINGLMFPVGDHVKLADALSRLINDSALRQRLADTALQIVRRDMSLPVVLNRFVQFYHAQIGLHQVKSAPLEPRQKAISLGRLSHQIASQPLITRLATRTGAKRGITTFMYHDVGNDDDAVNAWQIVRESDFLKQLEFVSRNFQIVTIDEAHDWIKKPSPTGKPLATITFDDGLRGNFRKMLPIIDALSVPVTIYAATEHIAKQSAAWAERLVNALQPHRTLSINLDGFGLGKFPIDKDEPQQRWAQTSQLLDAMKRVRPEELPEVIAHVLKQVPSQANRAVLVPLEMEELIALSNSPFVTIGGHTHGHEVLPLLTAQEIEQTVDQSMALLHEWTGQKPRHFAYPCGLHDERVQRVIGDMGFATAMSGHCGLWESDQQRLNIPRVNVGRWDTLAHFKTLATVAPHPLIQRIRLREQPATH